MLVILIHQRGRELKRLVRHSFHPVLVRSGDCATFANVGSHIRHCLAPYARDVAGDLRGRLHEEVPQCPGDRDVVGSQRDANPFLGVVVVVDGVVAPVSAVSVGRHGNPSRGLGCCFRCCGRDSDFYFSRPHFNRG
jgi:hypothetical protein